jgi:hypothetical protein
MRRAIVPILVTAGIITLGLYFPRDNQRREEPPQSPLATEDRIPNGRGCSPPESLTNAKPFDRDFHRLTS